MHTLASGGPRRLLADGIDLDLDRTSSRVYLTLIGRRRVIHGCLFMNSSSVSTTSDVRTDPPYAGELRGVHCNYPEIE